MAKATVKTKTGAHITIEGTETEVSTILAAFERTAEVGHLKAATVAQSAVKKDQRKRAAAADLVIELKEEGFFNKPRGLGEISKALEEKAYIYPLTTLSGVVLGLVKRKLLGRKKVEGKWVYGK
jgi:hypothetical protein